MRNFKLTAALLPLLLVTFAATPVLSGCSRHKTTTVTTTEVDSPRARYYPPAEEEVTVKTETTHDDTDHSEHHGVFSVLADIISLPFRAVGALFTAIF